MHSDPTRACMLIRLVRAIRSDSCVRSDPAHDRGAVPADVHPPGLRTPMHPMRIRSSGATAVEVGAEPFLLRAPPPVTHRRPDCRWPRSDESHDRRSGTLLRTCMFRDSDPSLTMQRIGLTGLLRRSPGGFSPRGVSCSRGGFSSTGVRPPRFRVRSPDQWRGGRLVARSGRGDHRELIRVCGMRPPRVLLRVVAPRTQSRRIRESGRTTVPMRGGVIDMANRGIAIGSAARVITHHDHPSQQSGELPPSGIHPYQSTRTGSGVEPAEEHRTVRVGQHPPSGPSRHRAMTGQPCRRLIVGQQGGLGHHHMHLHRHRVSGLLPGDPLDEQISRELPDAPLPGLPRAHQ